MAHQPQPELVKEEGEGERSSPSKNTNASPLFLHSWALGPYVPRSCFVICVFFKFGVFSRQFWFGWISGLVLVWLLVCFLWAGRACLYAVRIMYADPMTTGVIFFY